MNNSQIPKRYAQALFGLAADMNILQEVSNDMDTIHNACIHVPEFKTMLRSPIIKPSLKKKTLSAVFEKGFNDLSMRFIKLLVMQGRAGYMQDTAREFILLYRHSLGLIDVELTSAVKLSSEIVKDIERKIASFTNLRPAIVQKTNSSLYGGFTIRFGDNMYDTSIRKKLSKISQDFKTNIYEKGF